MAGLTLIAVLYLVGLPIVAIAALVMARRNRRRLIYLENQIEALRKLLADLQARAGDLRPEPPIQPTAASRPISEVPPVAPAIPPSPLRAPEEAAARAAPPPSPAVGDVRRLEERFTSRWLVWLGAVAIALAGTFLVKYAVERGWLGPATRVTLGFLLGLVLALGGEWLRRQPLQRAIAAVGPNHVPPALTAAGLFTMFGSLYAAHGLYDFLSSPIAFLALAAVAIVAVGLSLLHGWFVALMGLVGAFLTPLLIRTESPSAWTLFIYLLVIAAASLTVMRRQGWWWLGLATLAGTALWPAFWLGAAWSPGDVLPVGLYLLLASLGLLLATNESEPSSSRRPWFRRVSIPTEPEWIAWLSVAAFTLLVFALVRSDGYGTLSLVILGLYVALLLGIGRWQQSRDGAAVVAALLTLTVLAVWHLPEIITYTEPLYRVEGQEYGRLRGPILPPELNKFATVAVAFGGFFGLAGFAALWGARRPALWAGLSAAVPVGLLAIAYWRFLGFELHRGWAMVALALAAASLAAAFRVEQRRHEHELAPALGFYAAAVTASLSLGATMTLRQAWLTVALSLQLPALGWIGSRFGQRPIRVLAGVVAGVVLARLVLNFNILDYPVGAHAPLNWVTYGYGIPAIMFFWASRLISRGETDLLIPLLRAGTIAFLVLLVSLEIRVLVAGSIDRADYSLLEASLQTIAWLSIAYALSQQTAPDRVAVWGSRLLAAAAVLQTVLVQLWWSNPAVVASLEPVGDYPIVNLLFLAYAVPAIFVFKLATAAVRQGIGKAALALRAFGFILVLVYVTLEVRRAFQGSILSPQHLSDAEFYAYSVAWLALAAALLALGIFRKSRELRYVSLAVVMLTVLKVFIGDMADLTGLYRVASFLVLGLTLVGIGYLYQRYIFPLNRPASSQ